MSQQPTIIDNYFTHFEQSIAGEVLPERFTYPFFYEPHPLCLIAAKQLQDHLIAQSDWQHDFGIDHFVEGVNIGKMFGVLLVQNRAGEVGFLSAFSGKLAGQHNHVGFVPPVVDYLAIDSFFRKGERDIEQVTLQIENIEKSTDYLEVKSAFTQANNLAEEELADSKKAQKEAKKERKLKREEAKKKLTGSDYLKLEEQLKEESTRWHYKGKDFARTWRKKLFELEETLNVWEVKVADLKEYRRQLSNDLQQQIFDEYEFLNMEGCTQTVCEIFKDTAFEIPPSGAGDCAAPKMLQYAFLHALKPLAMAEFWWGQSPSSEIRKHGYFYPSCKGKCEPILGHMLKGMKVDESPMLSVSTVKKKIEVVFEDDHLVVINKPHEFLSVPGKSNADSVLARMAKKYPEATGPLLVHRLDRATSGLLLVAKAKEVHKALQDQFLTKTIKKRYVALLEGQVSKDEGSVDLPLRPDIEDRPRQLVDHVHGKPALTRWKVIERRGARTLVHFWPVTGRTHQLRMHAAHVDGLDIPMVGDDLYGKPDKRLHLQAAELVFEHPISKERMRFELDAEF
jgi:tRNA pseudouridine32 synthase/23S rRNA pseudouridine746 synthase